MGGALTIISAVHLPDVDAGAVYRYDAEHAFMNEARRRCTTRRRQSSRWQRSLDFMKQYID